MMGKGVSAKKRNIVKVECQQSWHNTMAKVIINGPNNFKLEIFFIWIPEHRTSEQCDTKNKETGGR